MLGNSYSFEALKFSITSNSVPLCMAQLKSEKTDLTKETAGFSYQKFVSTGKLKTKVLLNWNINIQLLQVILKAESFYYYTIFNHVINIDILNKITNKSF